MKQTSVSSEKLRHMKQRSPLCSCTSTGILKPKTREINDKVTRCITLDDQRFPAVRRPRIFPASDASETMEYSPKPLLLWHTYIHSPLSILSLTAQRLDEDITSTVLQFTHSDSDMKKHLKTCFCSRTLQRCMQCFGTQHNIVKASENIWVVWHTHCSCMWLLDFCVEYWGMHFIFLF